MMKSFFLIEYLILQQEIHPIGINLQASGSLYGALIGSVLAFTVADFLGLLTSSAKSFSNLFHILNYIIIAVINFNWRKTAGANSILCAVSYWGSSDCICTQFPYHGCWTICVWYRNWAGNWTDFVLFHDIFNFCSNFNWFSNLIIFLFSTEYPARFGSVFWLLYL